MENNPSTVAKEGANNRTLRRPQGFHPLPIPGKEGEVLETPFRTAFSANARLFTQASHAPLLPVVIYVLLLPALVYNYAIFSRGESYFFVSGDAPGSKSARRRGAPLEHEEDGVGTVQQKNR